MDGGRRRVEREGWKGGEIGGGGKVDVGDVGKWGEER